MELILLVKGVSYMKTSPETKYGSVLLKESRYKVNVKKIVFPIIIV